MGSAYKVEVFWLWKWDWLTAQGCAVLSTILQRRKEQARVMGFARKKKVTYFSQSWKKKCFCNNRLAHTQPITDFTGRNLPSRHLATMSTSCVAVIIACALARKLIGQRFLQLSRDYISCYSAAVVSRLRSCVSVYITDYAIDLILSAVSLYRSYYHAIFSSNFM